MNRPSILSGSWYPKTARECQQEIERFRKATPPPGKKEPGGIGGIVPHAGWFFSGQIACEVIDRLGETGSPDAVILFGSHLHPKSRPTIMAKGVWDTPLGPLEIQKELAAELIRHFDFQQEGPVRFSTDNTMEVQLPFLKNRFPSSRILPIGAPPNPLSLEIARACVTTAQTMGLHVIVLGSTDLTHYGPNYNFTPQGRGESALAWVKRENDRRMIEAILAMDPERIIREALRDQNACCSGAAAAAIEAARNLGADTATLLSYTTSYDRHPSDSFVGYAGILLHSLHPCNLD
jgi:AmmeMemoRadiSam system protein B